MKKIILATSLLFGLAFGASAQTFYSGYFLDNYNYGHRINPSLQSEKGYFGVGVNLGVDGNFGINNLLFKGPDGSLVTGLNSSVSASTFIGALPDKLQLGIDGNTPLVSLGFWGHNGGFSTIEVNLRTPTTLSVPKGVFEMLKVGSTGTTYDLSGLGMDVKAYAEVALGHSHKISDLLTIGAKVKVLVGLGSERLNVNRMDVTLGEKEWSVKADAELSGACNMLNIPLDSDGNLDLASTSFAGKFSPAGFGAAVDLGATFKPISGLEISAAVTDLGAISWKTTVKGTSSSNVTYTGASEEIDLMNGGGSVIGDELSGALNKLTDLLELKGQTVSESAMQMIPVNVNVAAKYKVLPVVKVGAMANMQFYKGTTVFDGRIGAAVTPLDWLSLAANVGTGTYGPNAGAALSVTLAVINIFAGVETRFGRVGSYNGLPVLPLDKFYTCATAGVSISVGKRHK